MLSSKLVIASMTWLRRSMQIKSFLNPQDAPGVDLLNHPVCPAGKGCTLVPSPFPGPLLDEVAVLAAIVANIQIHRDLFWDVESEA